MAGNDATSELNASAFYATAPPPPVTNSAVTINAAGRPERSGRAGQRKTVRR
jgi:hypothetical protein